MCWKEIGLRAENKLTILDAIVNIIEELIWSFKKNKNLHFDNIYMSFKTMRTVVGGTTGIC